MLKRLTNHKNLISSVTDNLVARLNSFLKLVEDPSFEAGEALPVMSAAINKFEGLYRIRWRIRQHRGEEYTDKDFILLSCEKIVGGMGQ
ncbi:hypothetical protein [Coxiella endosymbiont of Ornithodoros maritimus]|uniref:hypothetical protein n=1 Tax=Coxiella endosymbiont of Ornithodoros maritimus TaxID=1656172 RepID=UPI0022650180|nr:hypothetical protein [Coxiella endosymbiont of Ornithodoros maritimus]